MKSPQITQMPTLAQELKTKLENRTATIAVVGLGYVGLPLARAMHDAGFQVLGFDLDDEKIKLLRSGTPYLHHLHTTMTMLS